MREALQTYLGTYQSRDISHQTPYQLWFQRLLVKNHLKLPWPSYVPYSVPPVLDCEIQVLYVEKLKASPSHASAYPQQLRPYNIEFSILAWFRGGNWIYKWKTLGNWWFLFAPTLFSCRRILQNLTMEKDVTLVIVSLRIWLVSVTK